MPQNSRKIVFFDFDYTLAKTSECIKVWSPRGTRVKDGSRYRLVTPPEFNVLQIADDESIDENSFDEFYSVDVERAEKIWPTFLFLESFITDPGSEVYLLSARPPEAGTTIREFLRRNIDAKIAKTIKNIEYKGCKSGDPMVKYKYIFDKVSQCSPKEIFIFDDSLKVINYAIDRFRDDFRDIVLKTCLVEHNKNECVLHFGELQ